MHALVALSVQPKNGPEIHLGPGHPAVQYLWADLITRKGHLMSAVPIAVETITVSDRMGAYVVLKNEVAVAASKVGSKIAAAAQWVRQALHLDAGAAYVRSVGTYLRGKVASVAALIGRGGVIGVAMMALSTAGGRKTIKTLAINPITWTGTKIGHGYCALEAKIATDKKTGGFRNWAAGRMAAVRRRVEDTAVSIVRSRFIAKAAHLLRIEGPLMATARALGALMFFWSTLTVASTMGMTLLPAAILGGLAGAAIAQYVIKPIINNTYVMQLRSGVKDAWGTAISQVGAEIEAEKQASEAATVITAHGVVRPNEARRSNGRGKPAAV